MKKSLAFLFIGLFLVSLAMAQQEGNQINAQIQANAFGNQVGINAEVKTQLKFQNRSLECDECNFSMNGSQVRAMLSNGRNAEVKIMPETASETALARLRLRNCNESNNCSIELKEVGKGNQTKLAYEMQIQRHYKLLGMFRTRAENSIQIDAENGEVISEGKPWWRFLAKEEVEEN